MSDVIHIGDVTLTEDELKEIVAAVLLGLKYLHENNMIHRDIKAGNVLINSKGQGKKLCVGCVSV